MVLDIKPVTEAIRQTETQLIRQTENTRREGERGCKSRYDSKIFYYRKMRLILVTEIER